MNTETPTPMPATAQPKSIDERIAEAKEASKRLMEETKRTREAREPYDKAYLNACTAWCAAEDQVKLLKLLKAEQMGLNV